MMQGIYSYTFFPKWASSKGILFGLVALLISTMLFSTRLMPSYLYLIYIIEIVGFFYLSQHFSYSWAKCSMKEFARRIFLLGLILRIPFTIYYHFYYSSLYGPLYFDNLADIEVYVGMPYTAVQNIMNHGDWQFVDMFMKYLQFDDLGAPILNTFLLLLTGNVSPCGVPLIVNVLMGAYTSIFVYHIAQRHFGEDVARVTALFCMLNPNLIWWCCSLMKEIQMTFFMFWFVDSADEVLFNKKVSFAKMLPIACIGMYVFLYRAALGVLLFLAFFAALVLVSNRIVSVAKKVLAGVMVFIVLLLGFGNQMIERTKYLQEQAVGSGQKENMEWRAEREHGNQFAKYAGAAVFAPLIFTIPFPTVTYTYQAQEVLMEVAGGNFIKNILSYFVILCMLMFLLTGLWRRHVFPIAILIGYLVILVMSVYAQSGRFHVPALPLEMMFTAYCVQLIDKKRPILPHIYGTKIYKSWFVLWGILMVIVCTSWQWFKLKGQGLI